MLPELPNTLLSVAALASGATCAVAQWRERRRLHTLTKPLTMILVLALAVQPSVSTTPAYRVLIVAGLIFSLVGDVFLMLEDERFLGGLASFLVAHLFYVAAFATDGGLHASPLALLPFAVLAGGVYALLLPHLGAMRWPVALYVTVIAAMGWQALARWWAVGQLGALLAFLGAALFVFSDAALAWNRFRRPFRAAPLVVLGSYFPAQLLLALSVGVGEALVDWAIR